MTAGLPDFYRGVDIAYQALSEMIVRPKYGGAVQSSGNTACPGNYITTLASIIGKGVLYGGTVWLDHTLTQANSELLLVIDSTFLYSPSFFRMSDYGVSNPRSSILSMNVFDSVNHIYSIGLSYGITFESHLAVAYWEKHGTEPTVHYNFVYGLI